MLFERKIHVNKIRDAVVLIPGAHLWSPVSLPSAYVVSFVVDVEYSDSYHNSIILCYSVYSETQFKLLFVIHKPFGSQFTLLADPIIIIIILSSSISIFF